MYHVLHNRKDIFQTTTEKAMSRDYYYEIQDLKENKIEEMLSGFEVYFSAKLGKLIYLLEEYETGKLKLKEVKLSIYDILQDMVRMHLRSGALVYELGYWEGTDRKRKSIHRMLDRFLNSIYIYQFCSTLIDHYEICIMKSCDKNFIVSDQYLCTASLSFKAQFGNSTNRTIGLKDVIVLIPISKKYYLCFYNGKKPHYIKSNQFVSLKQNEVEEINRVIINNSYMETAGSARKVLADAVSEYQIISPRSVQFGGGKFVGGSEMRKEVFFYREDYEIFKYVSDPSNWSNDRLVTKNEVCPCGSGIIYKDCCRYKARAFAKFYEILEQQDKDPKYNPWIIPNCTFHEKNISDYYTRL